MSLRPLERDREELLGCIHPLWLPHPCGAAFTLPKGARVTVYAGAGGILDLLKYATRSKDNVVGMGS